MRWHIKHFENLSSRELYGLLSLRCEVFIVEQVAYQDPDGLDPGCFHIFAEDNGKIAACLRIIPPGLIYPQAGIGRLCVKKEFRKRGLAHKMLDMACLFCQNTFGDIPVRLDAQSYLLSFYKKHGFSPCGPGFLEDGIPHTPMLRKPAKS